MKRELYIRNGKSDRYLVEYDEEGIIAWYVVSSLTDDGWEPISVEYIRIHEPLRYTEALLHIDAILQRYTA